MNPSSWLPGAIVDGVKSATVKSSVNDGTPLLQSGSIDTTGILDDGYYRVEMISDTAQAIATLLFTTDGKEFDHGAWSATMAGKSVLAPAAERKITKGTFVPKGSNGAEWCKDALNDVIKAPVEVHGSFSLAEDVVIDLGASYIDAVWQVLDVGGWCMQIDGEGVVHIRKKPTDPKLKITYENQDLFMPKVESTPNVIDVPNVVIVYDGSDRVEVANDSNTSPTSVSVLGRRVEHVESSPQREEGETLLDYAQRKLEELSDVCETIAVTREWVPDIMPYDVIEATLPACDLDGKFRVLDMNLTFGQGILVEETWGRMS